MAHKYNPFLGNILRDQTKGGGPMVENPQSVENIIIQTAAGPLDSFEDRLADDLMNVFGSGAEEIGDVVAALTALGSTDRAGEAWTERSFRDQMASSAAALFAASGESR